MIKGMATLPEVYYFEGFRGVDFIGVVIFLLKADISVVANLAEKATVYSIAYYRRLATLLSWVETSLSKGPAARSVIIARDRFAAMV